MAAPCLHLVVLQSNITHSSFQALDVTALTLPLCRIDFLISQAEAAQAEAGDSVHDATSSPSARAATVAPQPAART